MAPGFRKMLRPYAVDAAVISFLKETRDVFYFSIPDNPGYVRTYFALIVSPPPCEKIFAAKTSVCFDSVQKKRRIDFTMRARLKLLDLRPTVYRNADAIAT